MSTTPSRSPIGGLIASLLLADLLAAKARAAAGTDDAFPDLMKLLSAKCDDPACEACHPETGSKQPDAAEAHDEVERVHVHAAMEIPHEVAELVGLTKPGFDHDSLEGHTRLLAAAFIVNTRKLGEQTVDTFPKAAATLSGIRYVENTILSALTTFASLAGK